MGITSWPCPSCGQVQTQTHENGEEVEASRPCAACAEAEVKKAERKKHPH